MVALIACRARLGDFCLNGTPVVPVYNESMAEDGTWDPRTRTVICTPCYAELLPWTPSQQGQLYELPRAIRVYQDAQLPIEERVRKFITANEGEGMSVLREDKDDGVHLTVLDEGIPEAQAVIKERRPIRWI